MAELLPKHTIFDRSNLGYQGSIHNLGVFVRSGTIEDVLGSQTGSATLTFDARALKLRRVEIFHSSSNVSNFNVAIENSSPNTGSFFDPRATVVCYNDIPGSKNYDGGLDQIEDMFLTTDSAGGSEGNIYIKFMPYGSSGNNFKYLLFFEAVFLYINKDGKIYG